MNKTGLGQGDDDAKIALDKTKPILQHFRPQSAQTNAKLADFVLVFLIFPATLALIPGEKITQ